MCQNNRTEDKKGIEPQLAKTKPHNDENDNHGEEKSRNSLKRRLQAIYMYFPKIKDKAYALNVGKHALNCVWKREIVSVRNTFIFLLCAQTTSFRRLRLRNISSVAARNENIFEFKWILVMAIISYELWRYLLLMIYE